MKSYVESGLVVGCLLVVSIVLAPGIGNASITGDELWFSPMPRMQHAGNHQEESGQGSARGERSASGSHSSHGHDGHESEHRPKPMRTYWLNTCEITQDAQAFLMQPEGHYQTVPIKREGHEVSVTVKTPFGEGPYHGGNNVYLVDQYVMEGTLSVNTAKWLTLHHSCGWGHEQKFNGARQHSQTLAEIPLEIAVDDLWDTNFHSTVMSGDTIGLTVLSYGIPVQGATVTVESEKGWLKKITTDQDGRASFQMVRDYYPEKWLAFKRDQRGKIKLTANFSSDAHGEYKGNSYTSSQLTSTFTWRYYPARREYASYAYGLLIAVLFMTFSGFGVWIYRDRRSKPYKEIRFDE